MMADDIPVTSFEFAEWLAANRAQLKPPTAGYTVMSGKDFMITVVGGPNLRTDYHINPFEEFYHQLEGTMTLRIRRDGTPFDIAIGAGETYLLPARVPHAPQRPAGTVGLIMERVRKPGELDIHEWYCERCNLLLFSKEAFLEVLERDMPKVFAAYYADPANQLCGNCGHENPRAAEDSVKIQR